MSFWACTRIENVRALRYPGVVSCNEKYKILRRQKRQSMIILAVYPIPLVHYTIPRLPADDDAHAATWMDDGDQSSVGIQPVKATRSVWPGTIQRSIGNAQLRKRRQRKGGRRPRYSPGCVYIPAGG